MTELSKKPRDVDGLVLARQLDILLCIEKEGIPPPVWFRMQTGLRGWAANKGLDIKPIFEDSEDYAVAVHGDYQWERQFCGPFYYMGVWVRADFPYYRKAMLKFFETYDKIHPSRLKSYDADHVVNRASLTHFPNSWVQVFPVKPYMNRGFGPLERHLPPIPPDAKNGLLLEPLGALKLLCFDVPKTKAAYEKAILDFKRRLLTPNAEMDYVRYAELQLNAFLPALRNRKSAIYLAMVRIANAIDPRICNY